MDSKNRFSELIPIVDEMAPNELWGQIKITTSKVAEEKLSRTRFQKKQWLPEEAIDLMDERRKYESAWEEHQQFGDY